MNRPTDPLSAASARPTGPLAPAGAPAPRPTGEGGQAGGVAFRALLERLEARASELEEKSRDLDASGLAGAVDTARASLEDAFSLSEKLLEAFREAATRPTGADPSPTEEERP